MLRNYSWVNLYPENLLTLCAPMAIYYRPIHFVFLLLKIWQLVCIMMTNVIFMFNVEEIGSNEKQWDLSKVVTVLGTHISKTAKTAWPPN